MLFLVFCNLFSVLQVVSAQLGVMSEESDVFSKKIRVAEISPMNRFELGPFESTDDNFYKDNHYVKAMNLKSKKMQESLTRLEKKKQSDRKNTASREIFNWKNYKGNTALQKNKNRWEGVETNRMHQTSLGTPSSQISNVSRQITAIRNQMQLYKILSPLLAELKSEIHNMETALITESFENLLKVLEKSFLERENRNTFQSINNITCNNRYQIGNIFAINRFSKLKEIINDSNERKMSNDDIITTAKGMLLQDDKELLNQLQRNFSKIFAHQNVSLEQMNQMSKIIDFVERFHGAVASSKGSKMFSNIGVKGSKKVEKVFTDDVFGFLDSEKERQREAIRRKGNVEH